MIAWQKARRSIIAMQMKPVGTIFARQTTPTENSAVVPRRVQFSGVVRDNAGKPLTNRVV